MNYVEWYIKKYDVEKLAYEIAIRIQDFRGGSVAYEFAMGSVTVTFLNDRGEIYFEIEIPENIFNNPDLVDSWVNARNTL